MGEVAEAQRGATEVLEAAIDSLCWAVAGAGPVEVGQHVPGPAFQSAAERDDLGQRGWNVAGEVLDHGGELLLGGNAIGIAVCLDDPLVDAPGRLHCGVLVCGEHAAQAAALAIGQEVCAGAEDSADPVERIPGSATMPAGGLLDPLPAAVQCVTGQGDDVERIHHRDGLRDLFRSGGLETGEPVHRHGLDPVAEALFLLVEPGLEHLLRTAGDHVQQPRGSGAIADRGQVDDHGDVLVTASGVGPDVLVHAEDPDPLEPGRIVDQELGAGFEDSVVHGVPGGAEVLGDPRDRHPVDDHALECPEDRVARQLRAGRGSGCGVLTPHGAAVRAAVATHSDLQHRRSPAEGDVHDRPEDRAARNSGLAAAMAPLIVREDPALQNCLARLDALAGGCEAEPVQAAEGIEIRGREGSVGHVEVFQMASVRTSIIGRPRRLSPHRRAHPATDRYTLICEEPVWITHIGVQNLSQ